METDGMETDGDGGWNRDSHGWMCGVPQVGLVDSDLLTFETVLCDFVTYVDAETSRERQIDLR